MVSTGSDLAWVSNPSVNITDYCKHDTEHPDEMEVWLKIDEIQLTKELTNEGGATPESILGIRVHFLANKLPAKLEVSFEVEGRFK